MESSVASWNIMVYGMSGAGKTTLAGTAPNAVFFNAEPGIIAAQRSGSTAQVRQIKTWQDIEKARTDAQDGKYSHRDWIIVDTVSTIQQKGYRYWTERQNKINPKYDEDIPDLAGHQKVQFMTRRLIADMVDVPVNMLFLCHAMLTENNDGSGLWLPSIDGQAKKGYSVSQYCMGLMNAVGFMSVKGGKKNKEVRRILWQTYEDEDKDIIYTAKEQFGGVLGRYTDNITMPELIERISVVPTTEGKKPKKKA